MSKKEKEQVQQVESRKTSFHYDELKQSDPKMSKFEWVNPKFNPGCLKRIKSKTNLFKKYQIQKEMFYMRDDKKVIMPVGEIISFI
jgi:hypothetical protein